MTERPLVSVVIPTHNRAELLGQALRSVADQGYRPLEVVVVDDGSVDETGAVVERLAVVLEECGVSLRFEVLAENSGPAAARNVGVRLASGSVFGFLDSDDLWRPEFVSTLVGLLELHPTCGLAFSGAVGVDERERVIGRHDSGLPLQPGEGVLVTPFELLIRKMPFLTPSVLVRRTAFEHAGAFDENLRLAEDWDMWYRLAKQVDFVYTLEPLVSNRHHAGNLGKNYAGGLAYLLDVSLRHEADVRDPETRDVLVERIRLKQTLLQEQLLREGRRVDEYHDLLDNDLAPTSVRYRLGQRLARGPSWLGRGYASVIRGAGNLRRVLASE
jgi:glycosyltransferase involved in cell wall biosynthesis